MGSIENGHTKRFAARREEVVEDAAKIFFKKGFSRTSMDDVMSKIGGSKRTLYKHFPSKKELFTAVVASVASKALPDVKLESSGDLRTTLLRLGTRYLAALVSRNGLALYRVIISEAPHLPELAQIYLEGAPRRVRRSLADFFRQQNKVGAMVVRNPDLAAEQFLALIRGDIHVRSVLRQKAPSKDEMLRNVECAVDTFLVGAVDRRTAKGAS